MGQNVEYHNDKNTKQHENRNQVRYETCGKAQKYVKEDHCKELEDNCHTKYVAGGRGAESVHVSSSHHSESSPQHQSKSSSQRSSQHSNSTDGNRSSQGSAPKSALEQRLSRCYDTKRGLRRQPCKLKTTWQNGKFKRDECGSGIVTKRFSFLPSRGVWCRTPLSMYQATIGEMARKLLCREVSVPRDVISEPPSNIAECILPPCRGYYRKYDCLRPCEEDYAVIKAGGKKVYRDRVERYWNPCINQDQKRKLDMNDYAPHNAYLGTKVKRKTIMDDEPCW